MKLFRRLFGKPKTTPTKYQSTTYRIDIDLSPNSFSKAFDDFFTSHFIDSYGLTRGDVNTYFFDSMTTEEKKIAKDLVRENLQMRQVHLFRAAGLLGDKESLPILYHQFETNTDFSWRLTIGQAIWKINGDNLYPKLLGQLKSHPSDTVREAHFEQVTDLKNEESIEMLLEFLTDGSDLVKSMAISKLNSIAEDQNEGHSKYEVNYFISRRDNIKFKMELLKRLQLQKN